MTAELRAVTGDLGDGRGSVNKPYRPFFDNIQNPWPKSSSSHGKMPDSPNALPARDEEAENSFLGLCLADHIGLAPILNHPSHLQDAIGRPQIANNSPTHSPKPQSHQIQEGVISIKPP